MLNFNPRDFNLDETQAQSVVHVETYRNFKFCIFRIPAGDACKSPFLFFPWFVLPTGEIRSICGKASKALMISHAKHWIDQEILQSQLQQGAITIQVSRILQKEQPLQLIVNGELIEAGQEISILNALKAFIRYPSRD